MLVGTAGFAAAEVTIGGSAGMGLQYNADVVAGNSKTNELSYVTLSFGGTVETDSGLTLTASTAYKVTNNGAAPANDDTTVSISGAFGTLSMGAVGEADVQGGLADIGFDGIGIDDVAEALDGGTHDVNYTYSAGALSVGLSAAIGGGTTALPNEQYAVGVKYTFGDSYVGVGYNSKNIDALAVATDGDTTSVYAGTSMSGISVNAMYSSFDPETAAAKSTAYGVNVAYTTGAATISVGYSDDNAVGESGVYGVGVAYDLGGGAALKAGVGKARTSVGTASTATKADVGVTFSF